MRKDKGFTLIELMIVIAIIAIIAAIAIPGLLQSQRASNERNASASLKTMATAEADFRANDRDGNRVQDFWTGDVEGLYSIIPTVGAQAIKLIDLSVAGADALPMAAGDVSVMVSGKAAATQAIAGLTQQSPKSGYWYEAMIADNAAPGMPAYRQATDASGVAVKNSSKFGFAAYPDAIGASGNWVFIINENNTVFKRQPDPAAGEVKGAGGIPPGTAALAVYVNWPSDADLAADWAKMD